MKWRSLEETAQATERRSLREVYAERNELIVKYVPAEIQAVHARAVGELNASGIIDRSLKVGSAAPDFELTDQNGKAVRSSEILQGGPLVVCFFRGRWCPFCVGQMEAMNAIVADLQELGATLVGISPQTAHQSFLMADQHKLRFQLLSDSGNAVARQFGIVYRVPEYQQEVYRRAFVNLPFVNGDSSWELPVPAVFILGRKPESLHHREHPSAPLRAGSGTQREDTEAVVLYASANPNYTRRPEPSDVLEFLASVSVCSE
jgi:peroxiredoxin